MRLGVSVFLVACTFNSVSDDQPISASGHEQAAIVTQIGLGPSAPECDISERPVVVGDVDSNVVKSGIDGVGFQCSVVPMGGAFRVMLVTSLGDTAFTLTGNVFAPSPKDVSATQNPNMTMTLRSSKGRFSAGDCVADYTYFEPAERVGTPITNAGVAAGRVWTTIRCPRASNGTTSCQMSATVRFENCGQTP